MAKYTCFSARAGLASLGLYLQASGIWEEIEAQVHIHQKTLKHRPIDKLKDAFINLLAGGQGIVEVNLRVRSDPALQRAFGRSSCAEQSVVSQTLKACNETTVEQLQAALRAIYQKHLQAGRHDFAQGLLLLDVDMTGLTCGVQAEGATKGYFSGRKHRQGRQLGRVFASAYDEIAFEKLYAGTKQLEKSLDELVLGAEEVLGLTAEQRSRTVLRSDGGAGTDGYINWQLARGYLLLTKVKNWQRTRKLAQTVRQWVPDPHGAGRALGWVESPHAYARPTRQLALRWPDREGKYLYRVLVTNLSDEDIFALCHQRLPSQMSELERMVAISTAYDQRGGAEETSFKASKQGLGLGKRNQRQFAAQAMLVYLAQLAYNLISWFRRQLPALRRFGIQRMVRDVFHIPGRLRFGPEGQVLRLRLNRSHALAKPLLEALHSALPGSERWLILDEI